MIATFVPLAAADENGDAPAATQAAGTTCIDVAPSHDPPVAIYDCPAATTSA